MSVRVANEPRSGSRAEAMFGRDPTFLMDRARLTRRDDRKISRPRRAAPSGHRPRHGFVGRRGRSRVIGIETRTWKIGGMGVAGSGINLEDDDE